MGTEWRRKLDDRAFTSSLYVYQGVLSHDQVSQRHIYSIFLSKNYSISKVNTDDFLQQAADSIISILTTLPNTITPSLEAGDPTRNILLKIATILNQPERLPVVSPEISQDDTYIPKVQTPKEPLLHPAPTPTSNIHAIPSRVVVPTQTNTAVPTPTYNNVTYKWKKVVGFYRHVTIYVPNHQVLSNRRLNTS